MRLLFVADGRSPIALNWIAYFVEAGHEVHLASSFACQPDLPLASLEFVPMAFSGMKTSAAGQPSRRPPGPVRLRTLIRQWLGPVTLRRAGRQIHALAASLQPDLVHAMRIPYEGMAAALAQTDRPLLISVWGNDFTLHAVSNPWMGRLTRQALSRTAGLHTDCHRDALLALKWGYPAGRPQIVLPGNGGIRLDVFYPPTEAAGTLQVINPRGIRAYVRNDTFFQAAALVLAARPEVRFVCPVMAGEPEAEGWVSRLGLGGSIDLLPKQSQSQMAKHYRNCQVVVSPSEHDGTPNTVLEAMACGCFPIVGDIESLREWIRPGENGLLVDPSDPQGFARAILKALERADLRLNARQANLALVAERAEYGNVMAQAEQFYQGLIKTSR